jgi:hypothetical protein
MYVVIRTSSHTAFMTDKVEKSIKTLEEKCVLCYRYRDLKLDLWDTSCDWSVQALLLLKSQIRIADTAKKKIFQSLGPLDFISPKF